MVLSVHAALYLICSMHACSTLGVRLHGLLTLFRVAQKQSSRRPQAGPQQSEGASPRHGRVQCCAVASQRARLVAPGARGGVKRGCQLLAGDGARAPPPKCGFVPFVQGRRCESRGTAHGTALHFWRVVAVDCAWDVAPAVWVWPLPGPGRVSLPLLYAGMRACLHGVFALGSAAQLP